jgi:hypothetical protein
MKNAIIAAVIIVILYYVYKMKETPAEDTGKRADPMPMEDSGATKTNLPPQGGTVIDSVPVTAPAETPLIPFERGTPPVNPIPQNTAGDDSKVIKNGSSDKPFASPVFGNPINTRNMGAANDITLKPVVKEASDTAEATAIAKAKRKNITPVKLPNLTTTTA